MKVDSTRWVDIGVNLSNKQFKNEHDTVLKTAQQHGVDRIIITGTDLKETQNAITLAKRFNQYATAGIHPHDAKENSNEVFEQICQLAQDKRVVAIGETGLDFNRNYSPPEDQCRSFEQHIELAKTLNKPMFLHERDANSKMIELLAPHRSELTNAVIHCFTGSKEDLLSYLEMDLYIGITGWVCDERRGFHLHELLELIPKERLLLETDAPFLLPRTLKPKPKNRRNEPQYLPHIGEYIAKLLGVSTDQLAQQTTANAERFFGIE